MNEEEIKHTFITYINLSLANDQLFLIYLLNKFMAEKIRRNKGKQQTLIIKHSIKVVHPNIPSRKSIKAFHPNIPSKHSIKTFHPDNPSMHSIKAFHQGIASKYYIQAFQQNIPSKLSTVLINSLYVWQTP